MQTRLFIVSLFICSGFAYGQNPGDVLFSQQIVHDINLQFYTVNYFDSLTYYKEQGDITGVNHYIPALVTIDGNTLDSVGIRFRGNASYNHPGTKKPIKLDFNEFISGQKFDGLKELVLNNSAYDPTMIREKLFLDLLQDHGIIAPRCVFARVSYNGQYVGLYKLLEPIDKTFLKTHFTYNDGNLYKGEPNAPLIYEGNDPAAYYDNFELNTNESLNDWSGLVQFIAQVNSAGAPFINNMEQHFDVHAYVNSWAVNNLMVNLDSYMYLPHNYYLYDDSLSGKFRWITWDVGLVLGVLPMGFQSSDNLDLLYLPDPATNAPLNNNLLRHDPYKTEYLNAVCSFLTSELASNKLYYKVDTLANQIRSDVYAEPVYNRMYTTAQFEGNLGYEKVPSFFLFNIPGLKDFIHKRRINVYRQLCDLKWSCATGSSYAYLGDDVINVYPNPANEEIKIEFVAPSNTSLMQYEIYDISGRRIAYKNDVVPAGGNIYTLNTSGLSPGYYVMRPKSECNAVDRKFIVVH